MSSEEIFPLSERLEQFERICDRAFRPTQEGTEPEVTRPLLEFLVRNHPNRFSQDEVWEQVYPSIKYPSIKEDTVRKNKERLRTKLMKYHLDYGKKDPLIIECPRKGYYVIIRRNPAFVATSQNQAPSPQESQKVSPKSEWKDVHCEEQTGGIQAGFRYAFDVLPSLSAYYETHTREREKLQNYQSKDLHKYTEALGAFLADSSHKYHLIFGQDIEPSYVKAILAAIRFAATEQKVSDKELMENQVHCYQLSYPGVMMNFDILVNSKEEGEVLFGLSQSDDVPESRLSQRVFRTTHPELVKDYSDLYKLLRGMSLRLETTTELEELITKTAALKPVDCCLVGNTKQALEYEMRQMKGGRLKKLQEVHARPKSSPRDPFSRGTLKRWKGALTAFLRRPGVKNEFEIVTGQLSEQEYLKKVKEVVEAHREKASFKKLDSINPLLNFDLLEYRDEKPQEVLFGWGQRNAVFRSTDSRVVREFADLYEALKKSDEERVYRQKWDEKRRLELWEEIGAGTKVRVLTTAFIHWEGFSDDLEKIIRNGAHVQIMMMNPKCFPLIEARFRLRENDLKPPKAQAKIESQLNIFTDLYRKLEGTIGIGTLQIRTSSLMPFAYYLQIGNKILLGYMMPLASFIEGPMTEVSADSDSGKILKINWEAYWNDPEAQIVVPPQTKPQA